MFKFYKLFYPKYLDKSDVYEAAKWNVITKEDYLSIVGEDYTEEVVS